MLSKILLEYDNIMREQLQEPDIETAAAGSSQVYINCKKDRLGTLGTNQPSSMIKATTTLEKEKMVSST